MDLTPEDFNKLARRRRSVFPKQFDTTRKVPDEVVEQILLNATWAPNHGQKEPWFFTVFTGQGLNKLAELQAGFYLETAGESFKADKLEKMQKQPLLASHIISIGMKRSIGTNIPEIEDVAAVACAVQNIYLSVAAYGLGGYWTTGGVTYMEKAKYHFGLAEADKLLGFFYIGHVAVPSPTTKRAPIEEKTAWVRG